MFYTIKVRFTHLTRLVLAGVAVLAIASPAHAISESKIKKMIVGKTVTFYHNNKDVEMTRYFDPNGTLYQVDEDDNFRRGHWAIDDGKLCFAFEGGSAKCRKFIKKKGKYGTANKKGKKLVLEITASTDGNQIEVPASASNSSPKSSFKEELVTLNTRKNVTDTFLLFEPAGTPRGVVLLLPGHFGVLHFKKFGDQYLVKNEHGGITAFEKTPVQLSKSGFVVALVTTPSDSKSGIDTHFRRSEKHSADINAIIQYLNDRYKQKVNLWGHCLSTVSPPAIIAHNNNQGVAGMILSSTRSAASKGTVFDVKGDPVRVRTLLVHHVDDPCEGTPYRNIPKVQDYYSKTAPEVDLVSVSGGNGSKEYSKSGCAGGYHGFVGKRKRVVKAVIKWLDHKPVPEKIN